MAMRIFLVISRSEGFIFCWSAVGAFCSRSRLFVFVLSGGVCWGSLCCWTDCAIKAGPMSNEVPRRTDLQLKGIFKFILLSPMCFLWTAIAKVPLSQVFYADAVFRSWCGLGECFSSV